MVICQQYSGSLERRKGFWEAFHHWLETRDFLVSEFKMKKKAMRMHTHTHSLALNSVSLFSDLSKMKNNATRTPILAVIGFADS